MELKTKVFGVWSSFDKNFTYYLSDSDMTTEGWVLVDEVTVQFQAIDYKRMVVMAAELLKKEKQKVYAEAQMKVNKIDQEINEMLALEHMPEQPVVQPYEPNDIPF